MAFVGMVLPYCGRDGGTEGGTDRGVTGLSPRHLRAEGRGGKVGGLLGGPTDKEEGLEHTVMVTHLLRR